MKWISDEWQKTPRFAKQILIGFVLALTFCFVGAIFFAGNHAEFEANEKRAKLISLENEAGQKFNVSVKNVPVEVVEKQKTPLLKKVKQKPKTKFAVSVEFKASGFNFGDWELKLNNGEQTATVTKFEDHKPSAQDKELMLIEAIKRLPETSN